MNIQHRQVGFIAAGGEYSRTGEGAFLRLNNGSIMLAYTEYDTADFGDDASAHLAAVYSHDEGETWGEHRILLEKSEGDCNVMSVSFLRLPNGEVLLIYLKKSLKDGKVLCQPCLRRSSDDCATLGEEMLCGARDKYYVVNNDRVIMLKNGRILMPAAVYEPPTAGNPLIPFAGVCMIVSDDNGHTWRETEEICIPVPHRTSFEEPGLYEHEDGTVWCYMRTQLGCQWQMLSTDGGETWSVPRPNMLFTSPASPMLVKKVCGLTVAVFNPIPNYYGRQKALWGRTPLVMLVSETDGVGHDLAAFPTSVMLEDDPTNNYCYPAILEGEGYFLLSYYHSNNTACPLNSLKIVKITIEKE
jgi:hypothetical protein